MEQPRRQQNNRTTVVSSVLLLFISALFAGLGGLVGSWYQGNKQIELEKQTMAMELHCETAKLINEAIYLHEEFVRNYGLDRVKDSHIPQKDLDRFNRVLKQINDQLAAMFLVMPDDTYPAIIAGVPPKTAHLNEWRSMLLCEMRKAEFPNTKHSNPDSIRYFYYKQARKQTVSSAPASSGPRVVAPAHFRGASVRMHKWPENRRPLPAKQTARPRSE